MEERRHQKNPVSVCIVACSCSEFRRAVLAVRRSAGFSFSRGELPCDCGVSSRFERRTALHRVNGCCC